MSDVNLATEILGSATQVSHIEFIGSTFAERRRALLQVDAYRQTVKQALHDTMEGLVGQEVLMKFRPSSVRLKDSCIWVSCYLVDETERQPLEHAVTIDNFYSETDSLLVTGSESPCTKWTVGLRNVLAIDMLPAPNTPEQAT